VNAHIFSVEVHNEIWIPLFHGKQEVLVAKVGRELTGLPQRTSVGRDHYAHRIPATHVKGKGKCQHI
jgi:hypothetical protein